MFRLESLHKLYCNKGNGFIKRNISNFPEELRDLTYLSLVRIHLEYVCVARDPYQLKDIKNLEKMQRNAAAFLFIQDYSKYNSVTRIIHKLG